MRKRKRIAELELKILQHLWNLKGGSTVHEILDVWRENKKPGYTTILKKLQIMEEKGIVRHKRIGKAYKYIAVLSPEVVAKAHTDEIIERAYSGDNMAFINAFISKQKLTLEEIEELQKKLNEKMKE